MRQKQGFAREGLADRRRIDPAYMSGIERGRAECVDPELVGLAKALTVAVSSLLDQR